MAATLSMNGRVHQIHLKPKTGSERGLPKLPVPSAFVTRTGLAGDFNRWRHENFNGDPDMAVLLLPFETLRQLNQEGWPVRPGDIGENITTDGVDYDAFRIGDKYKIGKQLLVEISKACQPCKNLYLLPYVGVEKGPLFLRAMLGRRGWYARVLQEGPVQVGDELIQVLP